MSVEMSITMTGQGSKEAFAELYSLTSGRIYAVVLMIVKRPDWAEDIVQEVYIKAWQNAQRFCVEKGSGMAWLSTIARRTAIDQIRAAKRDMTGKDGIKTQAEILATEIIEDTDTLTADVAECLKTMERNVADILALAFFSGYTHQEISANLGRPLGTIKSTIRRGLRTLKACLGT